MIDAFQRILDELGANLGTELKANDQAQCAILFGNKTKVQLQLYEKEHILVASILAKLTEGKYRETVFEEALKANGEMSNCGYLGYGDKTNSLYLFERFKIESTNGNDLHEFLKKFVARTEKWTEALEAGTPPKDYLEEKVQEKGGFF